MSTLGSSTGLGALVDEGIIILENDLRRDADYDQVKTIDRDLRKQVFDEVAKNWSDLASQTIVAWKVLVLSEVTGRSEKECREALKVTKGQVVSDAALALI